MSIAFDAHGTITDWRHTYRGALIGIGLAAVSAGVGLTSENAPEQPLAAAAAITGVVGMVVAGYAVSRRPKDSITLGLAALTAFLAGFATNPAWDSIRLM